MGKLREQALGGPGGLLRRIGASGSNLLRKAGKLPLAAGVLCLGMLGAVTEAQAGVTIGTPQSIGQDSIYVAPRIIDPIDGVSARCTFVGVPVTGDAAGQADVFVRLALPQVTNLTEGLTPRPRIHIGEVLPNQTKIAYFFLCAADAVAASVDGNPFTVNAYAIDPVKTPTAAVLTSRAQSLDIFVGDIKAQASKIDGVTMNPATGTWVGGAFTVTVTGTSGTVGAGERVVFSPAVFRTFRSDLFELRRADLTVTGGGAVPAACQNGSGSPTRAIDRLACVVDTNWNGKAGDYTITYTFVTTAYSADRSSASPLQYVDSGQNLKYPRMPTVGLLPPIQQPFGIAKTASPSTGGPAAYDTTYSITVSNGIALGIAEFSDIVDTLPTVPAGVVYVPGSTTITDSLGGSCGITTANFTLGDPVQSGAVLTWSHQFKAPAGGSCTLSFKATIPENKGATILNYDNCAATYSRDESVSIVPPNCSRVISLPPPQPGTITIIKNTSPTVFNDQFGFTVEGPGSAAPSVTTAGGQGAVQLTGMASGDYTINESTVPSGWGTGIPVCEGGTTTTSSAGSITANLPNNGSLTCTFTNTRAKPKLTVTKTLVNDPGQFVMVASSDLGGPVVGSPAGSGATSSADVYVGDRAAAYEAGYPKSESVANYDVAISCGNPAIATSSLNGITFTMPNQDVTCTITNTRKTFGVKLTKAWHGGKSGDAVSLAISGDPLLVKNATAGTSTVGGATTPATATAAAGSEVTVAETFTTGTAAGYATTLSCVKDSNSDEVVASAGKFSMPNDSAVTCTLTNAGVTVTKTAASSTPIGGGQPAVFNLTVTNNLTGTTIPAGYKFYEVVPQGSTYTSISNGTTDCAAGAAAGMLCTITVTNPIVAGTPQVVQITFTTLNPLPKGITEVFNLATFGISTPPPGCTASNTACELPPTFCPDGASCASVPTRAAPPPAVTPIPTTSPEGLIALALMVLGAAGYAARRRKRGK